MVIVLPYWLPRSELNAILILAFMFLYGFFYAEHRLRKSQYMIISFIFLLAGLLPINEKFIVTIFLLVSLTVFFYGMIYKNILLSLNSVILFCSSLGYLSYLLFN
ncbi:MAG: hypothetical protein M9962_13845 [Oligoflexia bacterium]|nr:hypothetical protein [Oligoflexia bacterium]